MNRFTVFLLVLVVIIAGTILYLRSSSGGEIDTWICTDTNVGWVKHGNPAGPMPIGGCGALKEEEKLKVPTTSFEETGNLAVEETGLVNRGESKWRLAYEKPGAPALRVIIKFVPNSVCDYNGDVVSCINNVKYTIGNVGDRVKITGEKADDTVAVSKMTMIKSSK